MKTMGRSLIQQFHDDEGGQVIIDYVLTLAVIISIVTAMSVGFRKSLFAIWQVFSREISAACPGCPPDPSVRLR